MMRRVLKEPFVHFLVLGAGLFVLNAFVHPDAGRRPDHIVVDARQTARLAEAFQRTRSRPPTRRELDALVAGYVKDEILYREALALGLDRHDPVIRRRLRQKMETLAADRAERRQPTDAELTAFIEGRPEMFRSLGRVSFHQVFFDPDSPVGPARERAAGLRARLNADPEAMAMADKLGDPTPLPRHLNAATETAVARIFGDAFADALAGAPTDRWIGPIESGHGVHLVRVSRREPGRLPSLDAVRAAVERDWSAARRVEAESRFYDNLRARYTVEIEMPPDAPGGKPSP